MAALKQLVAVNQNAPTRDVEETRDEVRERGLPSSARAHQSQHFALAVSDLDGAVAELRGRGLRVTDPAPVGTGRQSFLYDPAGNRIELQEPGSAAPGERPPWNPPVA